MLTLAFSSCSFKKKIAGYIYFKERLILSDLVMCRASECCNECSSDMLFITGQDTLQLWGARQDTSFRCGYIKYKDSMTCDTTITKCEPTSDAKIFKGLD